MQRLLIFGTARHPTVLRKTKNSREFFENFVISH